MGARIAAELAAVLLGVIGAVGAGSVDHVPATIYLATDPDDDIDPYGCEPGGLCGTCNPSTWDRIGADCEDGS